MPLISNWPKALSDFIEKNKYKNFSWGENDCIMFASSCINAITSNDPAAQWRGKYSTALSAARIFSDFGGFENMIDTVSSDFGYIDVPVNKSQRGDLVMHTQRRWPACGINLGSLSAFAGVDGLVLIKTKMCVRAWRIN